MDKLGVAIVGAGTIGEVHATQLDFISGVSLKAVADPNEEHGRALAGSFEAEWCASLQEVLLRDDVDVVVLCTPSGLHSEGAVEAAKAGKHIITEKPMAVTSEGMDRMISATEQSGVSLSVIFQYRFIRDALRLKLAADAGLFGRLVFGNALVHWHRTQNYYEEKGGWRGTWDMDGGGALMNQSVHAVDLLQWTLGPVESVSSYTEMLTHNIETEDTAAAALRFGNGALGFIQGTTSANKDKPLRVEVVGTEGSATFEGTRLTNWDVHGDLGEETEEWLRRMPEPDTVSPLGPTHGVQLEEIFAALLEGKQPPIVAYEARQAVETVLAIYRSARMGERVYLSEPRVAASAGELDA